MTYINSSDLLDLDINLLIRAVHFYKEKQEEERLHRTRCGWDTQKQLDRIQRLEEIEEKLFEVSNLKI